MSCLRCKPSKYGQPLLCRQWKGHSQLDKSATVCISKPRLQRNGRLHIVSTHRIPPLRRSPRYNVCNSHWPQAQHTLHRTAYMCRHQVQQSTPRHTVSLLRCRRTHDLPGMPRTRGSTTGSAHASRTLSKCRTGARHGTRDRSCPSARHTCTGPAGTPLGVSSSRGPMRPLVLPTPTRQTGTP